MKPKAPANERLSGHRQPPHVDRIILSPDHHGPSPEETRRRVGPTDPLGLSPSRRAMGRMGLLLAVHVVAANIQGRDGAKRSLLWTRLDHPGVQKTWADQGFAGRFVEWTSTVLGRELEIVRKAPGRRRARDDETGPARSETMIRWSVIGIMVRRLARGRPASRPGPRPHSSMPGL
ncbi:hypothetical protein ACFWNR_03870 [Streptomyces virginiae]|uniref:hypothetical protein n=1 Tax=Streptomyces virginiae TaxID=1961 RepID=UPI0036613C62